MTTLAPPRIPIRAQVSKVGDVLDGLELDVTEMTVLDALGIDLGKAAEADGGPSLVLVAALAWLQARRTTHPGISWEDAEPIILVALS